MCDDQGPFLGLGASYFQALRHAKYDRPRLERNLTFLAAQGFNYVRVLSMVNWDGLEIAPEDFTNHAGHRVAAWPDYWERFRDLLDVANRSGLRVEVTVFADAQYVMPERSARMQHLDGILANLTAYVFHSSAGVYARERFEDTPGITAMLHIRELLPADLTNWERHDGLEPAAPFTVFFEGQPNRYGLEVGGATRGCCRNIGSIHGESFVSFPMGILKDGVTLEARRPVQLQVLDPLNGVMATNLTLLAGQRFTLQQGPGAFLLKGRFLAPE